MGRKTDEIAKKLGIDKGAGNADITAVSGQLDYRHLFTMLESMPLEKMNQLDVCKAIYEKLVVKFMGEYQEERGLRIKYENTIIEKVGIIDRQERELVRLRALIPEEDQEEVGVNL